MGEVPGRVAELPRDRPIVVMCHHGVRSAHVVAYLREAHGFEQVVNLSGGIDAWSCDVDPRVPRY
jgi:rhodanese-related sulfurtransferase